MMIRIFKEGNFIYDFTVENFNFSIQENNREECISCGSTLKYSYVYIIKKLKKYNLLPEDYEFLCCRCKKFKDIGVKIRKCYKCGYSLTFDNILIPLKRQKVLSCVCLHCFFKKVYFYVLPEDYYNCTKE